MGFLADIGLSLAGSGFDALISGRQASKNREFQNQMSSTAMQRRVHDLKLAGLNPILAAGGQGASTPSGSMAAPTGLGQAAAGASSRSIQRQHMKASVAGMENSNINSALDAKYQTDAFRMYQHDPTVRRAVTAGILGQKAGVKGPIGAILGGGTSLLDRIMNRFKGKTPGQQKKKWQNKQEEIDAAIESYYQQNPDGMAPAGPTQYRSYPTIKGNNKTGFNLGRSL